MKDNFGREIEYLRISVTDRCNLRCRHCLPPQGIPLLDHEDILRYEEIARVVREAASLGIRRVRLTGGEPLLRPQLYHLVAMLKKASPSLQVVLTTNGVLLAEQLPALLEAGLDGVNISLNAMDREAYEAFTGRDEFSRAMEGLHAALACPSLQVKVNCVLAAGREAQLLKLASIARDTRASVRFIELMPIGVGASLQGITKEALLTLLSKAYGKPSGSCRQKPADHLHLNAVKSDSGCPAGWLEGRGPASSDSEGMGKGALRQDPTGQSNQDSAENFCFDGVRSDMGCPEGWLEGRGPASSDSEGMGKGALRQDPTGLPIQGPAEYYHFDGFLSDIGVISAMSTRFCAHCNRIRLTADGRLKSCLAYPAAQDVRAILRGGTKEELREALVRCIKNKPESHQFENERTQEDRLMSQIGG